MTDSSTLRSGTVTVSPTAIQWCVAPRPSSEGKNGRVLNSKKNPLRCASGSLPISKFDVEETHSSSLMCHAFWRACFVHCGYAATACISEHYGEIEAALRAHPNCGRVSNTVQLVIVEISQYGHLPHISLRNP